VHAALQRGLRAAYPGQVRLRDQLLVLLGAFALGTGVAELAGAENLGTAMAFGQIAFVIALVAVLLRS
jgi:hypothetical protein